MPATSDNEYFSALSHDPWLSDTGGQLSVDVIETEKEIVIRSAIAGAAPADLDIDVTQDTVTIRGKRHHGCEQRTSDVVHIQECYWGSFSRSIVLPHHVNPQATDAVLKNGILTITLKKAQMGGRVVVRET